jgi:DNA-binding NtrC family response regulator
MVADLGYRVVQAGSGAAACHLLAQHDDVAVLVTDLVMPGPIDGLDLAQHARELRPGLRILLTSGGGSRHMAAIEAVPPCVRYLSKPYQMARLARVLRELIDTPLEVCAD